MTQTLLEKCGISRCAANLPPLLQINSFGKKKGKLRQSAANETRMTKSQNRGRRLQNQKSPSIITIFAFLPISHRPTNQIRGSGNYFQVYLYLRRITIKKEGCYCRKTHRKQSALYRQSDGAALFQNRNRRGQICKGTRPNMGGISVINVTADEYKALLAMFPQLRGRTTRHGKIYIEDTPKIRQMIKRKREKQP